MANSDTLLGRGDTSAATRADEEFARTGRTSTPWQAYPERETFVHWTEYQRPDGSRYRVEKRVHRWGDRFAIEDPTVREV